MLTSAVATDKLGEVIATKAQEMPLNSTLQMVNRMFQLSTTDTFQNWFTAFAVLCVNQRLLAGELIQLARIADSHPEVPLMSKAELIDAIASGSKLTKADAG